MDIFDGKGEKKGRRRATGDEIVVRQVEVFRLRITEGQSYRDIGSTLGISAQQAYRDFKAALRDQVPAEEVAEARRLDLLKLDDYQQEMEQVLHADSPLVSGGKVVVDPDGNNVVDVRPKIWALGRLIQILQQRARLMGLNAPKQVAVVSPEAIDAHLQSLAGDLDVDLDAAREGVRSFLELSQGAE